MTYQFSGGRKDRGEVKAPGDQGGIKLGKKRQQLELKTDMGRIVPTEALKLHFMAKKGDVWKNQIGEEEVSVERL